MSFIWTKYLLSETVLNRVCRLGEVYVWAKVLNWDPLFRNCQLRDQASFLVELRGDDRAWNFHVGLCSPLSTGSPRFLLYPSIFCILGGKKGQFSFPISDQDIQSNVAKSWTHGLSPSLVNSKSICGKWVGENERVCPRIPTNTAALLVKERRLWWDFLLPVNALASQCGSKYVGDCCQIYEHWTWSKSWSHAVPTVRRTSEQPVPFCSFPPSCWL